ncbi:MAG: DUF4350 domain-containing protein [Pseudomonadota bacterium]
MSRRSAIFLGTLVVLLFGLLGLYLYSIAEPYQETVKHGPAPEVRANPFLAAEHFLQRRGLTVQRADSLGMLSALPSPGQTLMLLGDRGEMSPRQAERLLQWAAKGGHLLFVAERLWEENEGKSGDLLLDSLGIQQLLSEDLDTEEEHAETDESEEAEEADEDWEDVEDSSEQAESPADRSAESDMPPPQPGTYPELTKLYLENEQAPAYFDFDTDYHLFDAQNRAHAWANSAEATHLLQLYHGDGLITVLTDNLLWQTDEIDEYDHAWLLWYLSQDTAVTLLYNSDHRGLGSLLLRYFPQALAAAALLILLLLWHVGQRHGPLQAPASRARRQLEEHLRGSADFMLRRSGQQSLLQGLQQDIQRRARRRHPGFERLGVAEQWQVLGRLTQQPTSAIGQAMRPTTQRLSASQFTRQVAHLQSLRNAL